MRLRASPYDAPRLPLSIEALACLGGRERRAVLRFLVMLVALLAPVATPALGQEPPDAVPTDSLSAAERLALDQKQDSVSADTIFYNLPSVETRRRAGYVTGIWDWDRDAIMASGANTLAELFQDVPGVITLLGGDYGTPAAMSAFGQGGAGYRIVRDGFELYPVAGGVVDLQRVGLGGISRVRLDRSMAQMRVEMWSHEYDDGRSFSVIEAGTGDLDTNLFRGVYADPTALFGSLGVALERIDTRGRGVDEGGNRTGSWLRYQLHLRERAGLAFDFRRMGAQTKVDAYTPTTNRTDVMLKGSVRLTDGIVAVAYTGRSTYDTENGEGGSGLAGGVRDQHGASVGLDLGELWANAAFRMYEGDLPARQLDVSGGFSSADFGGVSGRIAWGTWNASTRSNLGVRAWLSPVAGVSVFGAYEAGDFTSRGAPLQEGTAIPPLMQPTGPSPGLAAVTNRTTLRVGASISRWGATVAGAALRAESDNQLPLGTELDLGAPAAIGVAREGVEGAVVFPTMWQGMTLEGSYQWWNTEGPNMPVSLYRGSFEFHRIYKESENLELWVSLGVRGHDPMLTFVSNEGGGSTGLESVPFFQNWYMRVQVRVVTVRFFIGWDNFTLRRNNQNYPGRTLPYARSFFALRWDMWN